MTHEMSEKLIIGPELYQSRPLPDFVIFGRQHKHRISLMILLEQNSTYHMTYVDKFEDNMKNVIASIHEPVKILCLLLFIDGSKDQNQMIM